MTDVLRYVGYQVSPGDLGVGDCTVRPARSLIATTSYWVLWAYVIDDEGLTYQRVGAPIAPHGKYSEAGGRKTWGFNLAADGSWQVSPSIHVTPTAIGLRDRLVHPEIPLRPKATWSWHHTPRVVGVPAKEPWM